MKFQKLLLVLVILFSVSAFAEGNNPFEPKKIAEFKISNWYPTCLIGSNCWADFKDFEGKFFFVFKLEVEEADFSVRTNGELTFVCKNDEVITVEIPTIIEAGESTRWIRNPCLGLVKKITTKAGIDGTAGGGILSYFVR
jgi:hypothetical protein